MRLCGNSLLSRTWDSFAPLQISFRRQTISRLHRRAESLIEHLAIIDAIEGRDIELAEGLAKKHVRMLALAVKRALGTNTSK